MHFGENIRQAFISLTTNKLRSILTMIGIIMGVFSVVAIMAISNATKVYMTSEFNKLGARSIFINFQGYNDYPEEYLKMDDYQKIKDNVEEIDYMSASMGWYNGSVQTEDGRRTAYMLGSTEKFKDFQNLTMGKGRYISESDNEGMRHVAVVTSDYAMEFYGSTDIIGEEIKVYNYYEASMRLKIVGVIDVENEIFGQMVQNENPPIKVYMPITLMEDFYQTDQIGELEVSVKEGYSIEKVGQKIIRMLDFLHGTEKAYDITSVADVQESVSSVLSVISSILLVIAVITLVVGGIGIINILLVSVTERIREIGLRKAIGAKKRDIILQFLTESIMMTGFSGLIGILLGVLTGAIISSVIKIPPVVDFKSIFFAFMGSVLLGLIFGVYPAKKAADLDPIESLRFE